MSEREDVSPVRPGRHGVWALMRWGETKLDR